MHTTEHRWSRDQAFEQVRLDLLALTNDPRSSTLLLPGGLLHAEESLSLVAVAVAHFYEALRRAHDKPTPCTLATAVFFLRATRYDVAKAADKYCRYALLEQRRPGITSPATNDEAAELSRRGCYVLRDHGSADKIRDAKGRPVVVFTMRRAFDKSAGDSVMSTVRLMVLALLQTVLHGDKYAQTHGVWLVANAEEGISLRDNFSVDLAKEFFHIAQDVFPLRIHGIVVLHEPKWIGRFVWPLVSPFIKPKLRGRIRFSATSDAITAAKSVAGAVGVVLRERRDQGAYDECGQDEPGDDLLCARPSKRLSLAPSYAAASYFWDLLGPLRNSTIDVDM